ncbi:hypothetical protein ACFTXJ_26610 [Streptomyces zhihengii]|uniref:hypothetical protein n=1 Tax=Streptomyces zhihengii TaxID=1818004 RepID=UPI0036450BC5
MGRKTTPSATAGASASSNCSGHPFGVPHALVIVACIIVTAFMAPAGLSLREVLLLVAGSGGIGAVIVILVMTGGRHAGGRISRFMRAYFTSRV